MAQRGSQRGPGNFKTYSQHLRGRIKKLGVARSREGVPKFRDIWRKRRHALANQNERSAFSLTF
jgi:hypothetical protein